MTNAEYTKTLVRNMHRLIADYNFDMTCENRDDFDRGEAIGIRRTLKLLGFEVEYAEDKTIKSICMPKYVDNGFFVAG